MVLSVRFLGAMNSQLLTTDGRLTTDGLQRRIVSTFDDSQLTPAQRLLKIRLFLRNAQEEAVLRAFYGAVNNPEINLLDESMNTHESVGLFRMLLTFRADPNVETKRNGSIVEQAKQNSNQEYLKAIEEQRLISLVEPAMALLLLDNETEKSADALKDLISTRVITKEELIKVIRLLITQKHLEASKLEELANIFESSAGTTVKLKPNDSSVSPYLLGALVGGALVLSVKYGLEKIQ